MTYKVLQGFLMIEIS